MSRKQDLIIEGDRAVFGRQRINIGTRVEIVLFEGVDFSSRKTIAVTHRTYAGRKPNALEPYTGYVWGFESNALICSGVKPTERESEVCALQKVRISGEHIYDLDVIHNVREI